VVQFSEALRSWNSQNGCYDTDVLTLKEDYARYESNEFPAPIRVEPNGLTELMQRKEYLQQDTLPHIFEVCWILNHPIFTGVSSQIAARVSFWSGTRTTVWNPMSQKKQPALYTVTVKKEYDNHTMFDVEKSTDKSSASMAWFIPMNDCVNRDYETDDDEIALVSESGQYPRGFFKREEHWNEFNKYSRLMKVDILLSPGRRNG
jgi:hypothetical protein